VDPRHKIAALGDGSRRRKLCLLAHRSLSLIALLVKR
jgi:hypothetical protein